MSDQIFGRGQIEWALWQTFAGLSARRGNPPQIFRTRIKRLLDIDRDPDLIGDAEVPPDADYAFVAPPASEGGESEYHAADAFCLAVALDLLDAGFKQREVVFLMRYLRPELGRRFSGLLRPPSLVDRQLHRAKDYPHMPTFEHRGHRYADRRVFVVLQKLELTEIRPGLAGKPRARPVFGAPIYCDGTDELGEHLSSAMPNHRRTATVVELAATAQSTQQWLSAAPVIRRGRPKA